MSGHLFDSTLPFSYEKFKKKFWPVQLLQNAPIAFKIHSIQVTQRKEVKMYDVFILTLEIIEIENDYK